MTRVRIFSRAIATGKEWKPCVECGKVFEEGEAIASFSRDDGAYCTYWYCSDCIGKYIYDNPQRYEYEGVYDEEIAYMRHRIQRLTEVEKAMLPITQKFNLN